MAPSFPDHVAVELFLRHPETALSLHLPCGYRVSPDGLFLYDDNGKFDWKVNPGGTAKFYHQRFGKALGRDTMRDVGDAVRRGATLCTYAGFHARSRTVAQSAYMIAFTWGDLKPTDGGTSYTWGLCRGRKVHVSIASLVSSWDDAHLDDDALCTPPKKLKIGELPQLATPPRTRSEGQ